MFGVFDAFTEDARQSSFEAEEALLQLDLQGRAAPAAVAGTYGGQRPKTSPRKVWAESRRTKKVC